MEKPHPCCLYESSVDIGWESLGEHVDYVVGRLDFLHFNLLALNEILCESEDVRIDVLHTISLDEANFHLLNTSCVVLKDGDRLVALANSTLLRNDLVHGLKPHGLSGGLMESNDL